MTSLSDRVKSFFTRVPLPSSAFQISSRYVCGVHFSRQERVIKSNFIVPLEAGLIQPSFYKKNIVDPSLLKERIQEKAEQLRDLEHNIAFLLPELSQKVFVFSFESLPSSLEERRRIIAFRIKKQMPLLPEDSRIVFGAVLTADKFKVLATVARISVVQEYEDFFHDLRLKIRIVAVPSLSLLNLIDLKRESNFIAIDVEEESFSLVAVVNSEIFLYRQKQFALQAEGQDEITQKAVNIAQEVENTSNFIEDREKRAMNSLWLRLGVLNSGGELFQALEEKVTLPAKKIETLLASELRSTEKRILSPSIGQVL